jgi:hypothetical protein
MISLFSLRSTGENQNLKLHGKQMTACHVPTPCPQAEMAEAQHYPASLRPNWKEFLYSSCALLIIKFTGQFFILFYLVLSCDHECDSSTSCWLGSWTQWLVVGFHNAIGTVGGEIFRKSALQLSGLSLLEIDTVSLVRPSIVSRYNPMLTGSCTGNRQEWGCPVYYND